MSKIDKTDKNILDDLRHKIDNKTKPVGSLGKLEQLAIKIGTIQQTLSPELQSPSMFVFAGDNGIAESGVSPFPKEVTMQMVMNFINGGAAINVFCKQNDIDLKVVDTGVDADFEPHDRLISAKIERGTKNILVEPAMTLSQCHKAIEKGAEIIESHTDARCNVIGFGEMGIGNTSTAALLMSHFLGIPIENCVGRGTGLDDHGLAKKIEILKQAAHNYPKTSDPITVLSIFGGFEIAMMAGAMLQAAKKRMTILIDGFIATSALLTAYNIDNNILDYCIACHQSDEHGHKLMLNCLGLEPVLDLNMRLGEGTGAAVAYPIIKSAVNFLNQMASFESAGVSNREDN